MKMKPMSTAKTQNSMESKKSICTGRETNMRLLLRLAFHSKAPPRAGASNEPYIRPGGMAWGGINHTPCIPKLPIPPDLLQKSSMSYLPLPSSHRAWGDRLRGQRCV